MGIGGVGVRLSVVLLSEMIMIDVICDVICDVMWLAT